MPFYFLLFCGSYTRILFISAPQNHPYTCRTVVIHNGSWIRPVTPQHAAQETACRISGRNTTLGYQLLSAANTIPSSLDFSKSFSVSMLGSPHCEDLHQQVLRLLCFLFLLTTSRGVRGCSPPCLGTSKLGQMEAGRGREGWRAPRRGRKQKGVTSLQAELVFTANLLGALAVTALVSH